MLRDYAAAVTQPTLSEEAGRYDELTAPDGTLRPAWKGLGAEVAELTSDRLRRVRREIGRFLSDDGVTYTRPGEEAAPWRLDPLPLVISADEWAVLEVGLTQRSELLNAVLQDLYGPQRLLSSGVLPSAAVYGHRGFVRAMARPSADPQILLLSATDLGRNAAGEWRALADRTQAPSGIGYAMENRRVISRVLPELYREAGLHRMAPYFQAMRSALLASAPEHVPNPRVVVLSPGTHSETAYDQAFIASSLGFPLVQGSDLVVREGSVWMRVFGRLERVDVVLRRVDAAWSDPLELRGESQLGVAGLAEAARRGSVRIVNGLGSGVLENPALLPYMSAMCELLLDEPLRIPSLSTSWLGEPSALDAALDQLGSVVVRAIDRPGWRPSDDLEELRTTLRAEPHRFVVQEPVTVSQTAAVHGLGVAPVPVALRTFTMRYGSTYRPLMGGLASVLDAGRSVSSKDVWVLKDRPEDPDQGLADVLAMTNVRAPAAMVPRVLEDMFWFGRYAERTEDMLRLVLQTHAVSEDFRSRPYSSGGATLRVLMSTVSSLSPAPDPSPDADFRSNLLDPHRPGSVAQSLAALRDAAQGSRDQLSSDVWRAFGSTDRAAQALVEYPYSHQVAESAGRMLSGVLSLYGVTSQMMRDPGWYLLETGRSIERGLQLVRLLRATTTIRRGIDVDRDVHQAVLAVAESAVTHRRRYRDYVRLTNVLDLLLLDPENPRSLRFALTTVQTSLAALPTSTGSTRPERLVLDLLEELDRADLPMLGTVDGEGRPHLQHLLDVLLGQLARLADSVVELHLSGARTPRSFGLGPSGLNRLGVRGP